MQSPLCWNLKLGQCPRSEGRGISPHSRTNIEDGINYVIPQFYLVDWRDGHLLSARSCKLLALFVK